MKATAVGILLCFLSLYLQAHTGTEGHGGDEIRLLFEDGRADAFQRIPKIKRCSLPAATNTQVVDWILKNKNLLAMDIFKSQHVWITDQQATCAFTQTKSEFDITLSFQTCENVKDKETAGRLLTHESVHHLGIADESFADAVAFAVYAADLNQTCSSPMEDPFDPLSCTGESVRLDELMHLLKPNSSFTPIGTYKVYSRVRDCRKLGGCDEWQNGFTYHGNRILLWNNGTPVDPETELAGSIDLVNQSSYVQFGLKPTKRIYQEWGGYATFSSALDEKGFFATSTIGGVPKYLENPRFAAYGIDGEWVGKSPKWLESRYTYIPADVFGEASTKITNHCMRTSWTFDTRQGSTLVGSWQEIEVVSYGKIEL